MLYNLSIPSFSVEQSSSNLARGFGLSKSQVYEVSPSLNRFDGIDFDQVSLPYKPSSKDAIGDGLEVLTRRSMPFIEYDRCAVGEQFGGPADDN